MWRYASHFSGILASRSASATSRAGKVGLVILWLLGVGVVLAVGLAIFALAAGIGEWLEEGHRALWAILAGIVIAVAGYVAGISMLVGVGVGGIALVFVLIFLRNL